MIARRGLVVLAASCLSLGGLLLGERCWMAVKACAAEVLIDRAFEAHLRDGAPHPPWNWADTHPVARLEVPRLGVRRTVLAGASGSSLAFGPGHVDGTAAPNAAGNCVLAGHRDTWFAFLERLRVDDELVLATRGERRHYRIASIAVRPMWDASVVARDGGDRLTLVTCFPFDGLVRSPRRYVVTAVPVGPPPGGAAA